MKKNNIGEWRPGILPKEYIRQLREQEIIKFGKEESIDNSSIDLHLSVQGWEVKGSLKLRRDESFSTVTTREDFIRSKLDLSKEVLLKPHKTYVVQLQESIDPRINEYNINGRATGKSTIGRLDVLTRLIVDKCERYDVLPKECGGPLYLEITPITFPIIVKVGDKLNQLRFFRGEPKLSELDDDEVKLFGQLTDSNRKDIRDLTLDLSPTKICDKEVIAFTTQKTKFTDDEAITIGKPSKYDPGKYWRFVEPNHSGFIEIEKDKFYILRSKERFRLPEDVGVYCQAITENLGEIRIHYAGFVHPGFGYFRKDNRGTPLIFEVRGHTVNAFLRDGELMAKVSFYRTSNPVNFDPKDIEEARKETYNNQELQLSKYFKKWKK
ncbi:MAG: 2'-deoxycytidine 5'-triphosphate deaminase [Candidatus Zixiibacteriota bacterium]